jgi:hypothetical protein
MMLLDNASALARNVHKLIIAGINIIFLKGGKIIMYVKEILLGLAVTFAFAISIAVFTPA